MVKHIKTERLIARINHVFEDEKAHVANWRQLYIDQTGDKVPDEEVDSLTAEVNGNTYVILLARFGPYHGYARIIRQTSSSNTLLINLGPLALADVKYWKSDLLADACRSAGDAPSIRFGVMSLGYALREWADGDDAEALKLAAYEGIDAEDDAVLFERAVVKRST